MFLFMSQPEPVTTCHSEVRALPLALSQPPPCWCAARLEVSTIRIIRLSYLQPAIIKVKAYSLGRSEGINPLASPVCCHESACQRIGAWKEEGRLPWGHLDGNGNLLMRRAREGPGGLLWCTASSARGAQVLG